MTGKCFSESHKVNRWVGKQHLQRSAVTYSSRRARELAKVLSASSWKFPEKTRNFAMHLDWLWRRNMQGVHWKIMRHLIILTYVNQITLSARYSRIPRFESWLGQLYSTIGFSAVYLNYLYEMKQLTCRSKARYLYTTGTRIKITPSAK
jgi:hypothetical protein